MNDEEREIWACLHIIAELFGVELPNHSELGTEEVRKLALEECLKQALERAK